jgi:hypothetical protein
MIDVYESAVHQAGRYGAAFERDGETAFFYLLDLAAAEDMQIIEAFNAHTVTAMPPDVPIAVRWAVSGEAVGLYVAGELVALFDLRNDERKGRWATEEDRSLFVRH